MYLIGRWGWGCVIKRGDRGMKAGRVRWGLRMGRNRSSPSCLCSRHAISKCGFAYSDCVGGL